MRIKTLISLIIASLTLVAAPAALAKTRNIGNSSGTPTMNVCAASIDCTYINYHHGKPSDVVKHKGTIVSFAVNAGSIGGQVELRVLRPMHHGKFKVVRSSASETVSTTGVNTFTTHLKVRRGDVLALSNDTSGIYMASAPSGNSMRYFQGPLADGSSGKPTQVAPRLHLLLSARVKY